ncbi:hypothetical protein [Methanobrevibacter sp.]|uniref:hypothetical protein n=1 Tax=Methanobrevibacter sp. TaxID=66852 RepID=UPI0038633850
MNFVKLFTDYKIDFNTRVNRGWTNVTCPFCDDKTFNGGFNDAGDYFHCWKCGGHDFKEALTRVVNISFNEVDILIEQYAGRNSLLNKLNKKQAKAIQLTLPTNTFTPAERKYLKQRNFSPKLLHEKYKIVGGGITGAWKYRIIIPLILDGKIVSWTGRSILSKQKIDELKIPRYKNLSIEQSVIDPKSILYNLDNCMSKTAVLTEGAFDVMRLGDGFFCSFGTELTQAQIIEIKNRFSKVFIMFDNEVEAQIKARKFGLQIASMGVDVEIVDAYGDFDKNDGGELTESEVQIIRKELGLNAC